MIQSDTFPFWTSIQPTPELQGEPGSSLMGGLGYEQEGKGERGTSLQDP